MYLYLHVYVYVHICAYVYVSVSVYVYVCMYVHLHRHYMRSSAICVCSVRSLGISPYVTTGMCDDILQHFIFTVVLPPRFALVGCSKHTVQPK